METKILQLSAEIVNSLVTFKRSAQTIANASIVSYAGKTITIPLNAPKNFASNVTRSDTKQPIVNLEILTCVTYAAWLDTRRQGV